MSRESKWAYVAALAGAAIIGYFAITAASERRPDLLDQNSTLAETSPRLGSLTIVTLVDGNLVGGAIYRISPDPFTGAGNYTVHDGDVGRDASFVDGIVTLNGIAAGTFSITQLAGPEGQERDIIPRVLTISNSSSEVVTFGAKSRDLLQDADMTSFNDIESITYAAKFECGTIRGSEGPLRPGHYDTDIGIFNKQSFPVNVAWTASSNDNKATNAILRTLGAQTSSSIVCSDIRSVLGEEDNFAEGFVLLEVPVDPRLLSALSGSAFVSGSSSQDSLDILDVQIFYTANALEELPHPVFVDKISFVITSTGTVANIPDSMIGKILDITLPSEVGKISDPVERVKAHLVQNYNMTLAQVSEVSIEIKSIDIGVGTMIDDHAVSLSKVRPQAKSSSP